MFPPLHFVKHYYIINKTQIDTSLFFNLLLLSFKSVLNKKYTLNSLTKRELCYIIKNPIHSIITIDIITIQIPIRHKEIKSQGAIFFLLYILDAKRDYFTDKDNFNTWKSNYLERHKSALLTKKQYEQLTHTEMLRF